MTNRMLDRVCRNVLVIEDDEDIRDSIVETLNLEGYEVYSANNGQAGMTALEGIEGPTLVLLDMMMPVMNGWQFIAAQKNQAKFADISVVVVSATSEDRALMSEGDLLPVEGLLRKPVDIDKLLTVVGQYCVPRNDVESAQLEMAAAEQAV